MRERHKKDREKEKEQVEQTLEYRQEMKEIYNKNKKIEK